MDLIDKNIDWTQNPEGVHMFEVGWFAHIMGYAEMSNELLEKVANRKDYIAIITKFLPNHVDIAKKFGKKTKPTKEMKEYMRESLIRGVESAIIILEDFNFSEERVTTLKRSIEQIEKHLS